MANYYEAGSTSAPETPLTRRKKMMAEGNAPEPKEDDDSKDDMVSPAKKFIKGFTGVK